MRGALILLFLFAVGIAWSSLRDTPRAESQKTAGETGSAAPPLAATPPAASPTADDGEPSPQQTALRLALEKGDLCETRRRLQETDETETYGALLSALGAGGEPLEMYGEDGPLFATELDPELRYQSPAARTAWALRLGGLITTPIPATDADPPPDFTLARARILELEKDEPGNAFYPLFRLVAESRLGYPASTLKATAEAAAAGSYLDPHLQGIERELSDAAWANPAIHNTFADFHAAAQPEWYEATKVLHRLEKETGFGGNARIAELLAEEARSSDVPALDGGFDRLRYYAANDLDPAKVLSPEELNRARGWNENRPWPLVSHSTEGVSTCAPEAYEAFFLELRERLRIR